MAFSEAVKAEVKSKSMFQCCRCHNIGVDVHHIIPQKDGGPDDIDNAAPLCQNCHDQFGDNPSKRKEIRLMRDNWYATIQRMYSGQSIVGLPLLSSINQKLENLENGQQNLLELKALMKEVSDKAIGSMNLSNATVTVSGFVNTVMASSISRKKSLVMELAEQLRLLNVRELYHLPNHKTTKDWLANTAAILKNLDENDYKEFLSFSEKISPTEENRAIRKEAAHKIDAFMRRKVAEYERYDFS